MYRRYSTQGTMGGGATSSSAKTLLSLISSPAPGVRPYIYDFTIGTVGTPSDSVLIVTINRLSNTTAGTNNTSSTPDPLDSSDTVAASASGSNYTAEPTIGVVLFQTGLNVRATYRWVAAPGGELVAPATSASGLGIRASSPVYNLDISATAFFAE